MKNRFELLTSPATPNYVKGWFKLCDEKDITELANWSEMFAKILDAEAREHAQAQMHHLAPFIELCD